MNSFICAANRTTHCNRHLLINNIIYIAHSVCVYVWVCARVRACVRVCMRACVRVSVCLYVSRWRHLIIETVECVLSLCWSSSIGEYVLLTLFHHRGWVTNCSSSSLYRCWKHLPADDNKDTFWCELQSGVEVEFCSQLRQRWTQTWQPQDGRTYWGSDKQKHRPRLTLSGPQLTW